VQALGNEGSKLAMMANDNANRATWSADVLARKMTIVNGTGTVHGASYDLSAQYKIDDRRVVNVNNLRLNIRLTNQRKAAFFGTGGSWEGSAGADRNNGALNFSNNSVDGGR
jgi:hypothetical protein